MQSKSWQVVFVFVVAAAMLGAVACSESDDAEGTELTWVEQPATAQDANTGYLYRWQVTGGAEVEHTNIHACPADEFGCKPPAEGGTRHDGAVLIGVAPGTYDQNFALPPGQWVLQAHARVDTKDNFLAMDGAITVNGVGFDNPAKPFGVDAGTAVPAGQDLPIAFRAFPEASGAMVTLCPAPVTDPATECTEVAATQGAGSLFTATVTPPSAGDYTVQLSATVGGTLETFQETLTVE